MMSNSEAKLHLSLNDGVFEISGSELFVSQQIENFKEIILTALQNRQIISDEEDEDIQSSECPVVGFPPSEQPKQDIGKKTFPRVLHVIDTDIRIIKKMPGGNNAKKTINTALAYLWGKKSVGIEEVSFQEIRDLCQHQSCLDSKNFSTTMKQAREYIIIDGKKGSSVKTCKLTLPGLESAEKLLGELNGE